MEGRHNDAAELLLSARRDITRRLHGLPEAVRPRSIEEAYLVQRAVMDALGDIGGWKVGAPRDGFRCAPLAASGVMQSPAEIDCHDRCMEAEIAFRLVTDLSPRAQPYTDQEIIGAIESVHSAIEVLDSRFADVSTMDPLSVLADGISHLALVVGPAIVDWWQVDVAAEQVHVLVNGTEVNSRYGNPARNMVKLLAWLANHGARWAGGLKRGQIVTTGSWAGQEFCPPGAEAVIRFDHCGEVCVKFT